MWLGGAEHSMQVRSARLLRWLVCAQRSELIRAVNSGTSAPVTTIAAFGERSFATALRRTCAPAGHPTPPHPPRLPPHDVGRHPRTSRPTAAATPPDCPCVLFPPVVLALLIRTLQHHLAAASFTHRHAPVLPTTVLSRSAPTVVPANNAQAIPSAAAWTVVCPEAAFLASAARTGSCPRVVVLRSDTAVRQTRCHAGVEVVYADVLRGGR